MAGRPDGAQLRLEHDGMISEQDGTTFGYDGTTLAYDGLAFDLTLNVQVKG